MKKIIIIGLSFLLLIILVGLISYNVIDHNLKSLLTDDIEEIELSRVDNGEYIGTYEIFPISVEVSVKVIDHKINQIAILKHDNGQGKAAESIIDSVIKENSIHVDVVSGASYSSQVILHAISNAINQK